MIRAFQAIVRVRGPLRRVPSPGAFPPRAPQQRGGSGAHPGGRPVTPHAPAGGQPGAAGEGREENAEEEEEEQAEEAASPALQRPLGSHRGEVRAAVIKASGGM